MCRICNGCVSLMAVTILLWDWPAEHSAELTIKPVDTHHKVNTVIKLLVVLLRGEVGQIRRQERKVAVQAGLKAQLFEQLLFGFAETGENGKITRDCSKCVILITGTEIKWWSDGASLRGESLLWFCPIATTCNRTACLQFCVWFILFPTAGQTCLYTDLQVASQSLFFS